MCGVVSIIYENDNKELGRIGVDLLKRLEYRGYDSTGGAFIKKNGKVILKKKVGSPSKVTELLEMDKFSGYKFIGQVRWATYGAVTDLNAQPHEINCFKHFVGAHNGNISNTDTLKEFLVENNHKVKSDNDGEMLIHVIEHFYEKEIKENLVDYGKLDYKFKIKYFINAIRKAHKIIRGSYASCITCEGINGVFGLKAGSSLYAGIGSDNNGNFVIVSSDLTSVLSKTRFLIPLSEGEGIYFESDFFIVFPLSGETYNIKKYDEFYKKYIERESNKDKNNIIKTDENEINDKNKLKELININYLKELKAYIPDLKRSKLNISDVSLNPPYQFFMEQEIATSSSNIVPILVYYFQDVLHNKVFEIFEQNKSRCKSLIFEFIKLQTIFKMSSLIESFNKLLNSKEYLNLKNTISKMKLIDDNTIKEYGFKSDEKSFLNEILSIDEKYYYDLIIFDLIMIWKKKRKILRYKKKLIEMILNANRNKNKVYIIGAGTSYHASLIAGYFFNKIANIHVIPSNPGNFRSQYINTLSSSDIVIAVSQSGETKDIVDIINDINKLNFKLIKNGEEKIHIISIVNNENSTIPQEKSDFYLPILCGPEIAVAATKSFINQIIIFYLIAISIKFFKNSNIESKTTLKNVSNSDFTGEIDYKIKKYIEKIKTAIEYTFSNFDNDIDQIANDLFLEPSIHILGTSLIGLAKEGALKIREVVLNHTEGFDAAEFKHGPNTILGKNTIYSLVEFERLLGDFIEFIKEVDNKDKIQHQLNRFLDIIGNSRFKELKLELLNGNCQNEKNIYYQLYKSFKEKVNIEKYFRNYPLIFICTNSFRDVNITISQIHTHKIRGANIYLIAPENKELEKAVINPPSDSKGYKCKYVKLPNVSDEYLFVFQASILLQLLAFKMSVKKMKYLNKLRIENHGVHPDVPKNVSKSITVD